LPPEKININTKNPHTGET